MAQALNETRAGVLYIEDLPSTVVTTGAPGGRRGELQRVLSLLRVTDRGLAVIGVVPTRFVDAGLQGVATSVQVLERPPREKVLPLGDYGFRGVPEYLEGREGAA